MPPPPRFARSPSPAPLRYAVEDKAAELASLCRKWEEMHGYA
jgi:hypothetical protein